jgi:hypothetical protein
MRSEAEMIQDIIKKFQVPEAVIGMHDGPTGPVVESTPAKEETEL